MENRYSECGCFDMIPQEGQIQEGLYTVSLSPSLHAMLCQLCLMLSAAPSPNSTQPPTVLYMSPADTACRGEGGSRCIRTPRGEIASAHRGYFDLLQRSTRQN